MFCIYCGKQICDCKALLRKLRNKKTEEDIIEFEGDDDE